MARPDMPPSDRSEALWPFYLLLSSSAVALLLAATAAAVAGHAAERSREETASWALPHLGGLRCAASFWILAVHVQTYFFATFCGEDGEWGTRTDDLAARGHLGVYIFVVMSGFVTDWTGGGRYPLGSWRALARFYLRRADRVLLSAWVSMLATAALDAAAYGESASWRGAALSCVLCLPSWSGEYSCPNGSTWTVGALLVAWLLYPLFNLVAHFAADRGGITGLVLLFLAATLLAGAPLPLWFGASGWRWPRGPQPGVAWYQIAWYSPPLWVGHFFSGAAASAVARRLAADAAGKPREAPPAGPSPDGLPAGLQHAAGVVSDGCCAVLCWLVLAVDVGQRPTAGPVDWSNAGGVVPYAQLPMAAAPALLVLYLAAASLSCGRRSGLVTRALRHPLLQRAGKYSFAVYLWQEPLFRALAGVVAGDAGCRELADRQGLLLFLACLLAACIAWTELVEAPATRLLRRHVDRWTAPSRRRDRLQDAPLPVSGGDGGLDHDHGEYQRWGARV
mmetsp:Transcript_3723/g.12509  ORF Transcript_3723/g.12509 Transcript_3723/m.12509 type:complete len:508 (+) Transcript_3723:47-1570(+)